MGRSLVVTILLVACTLASTKTIGGPILEERIVGGWIAPEGAFPYQASLRYYDFHNCGAIIIHPEWVITAASCVKGRPEVSLSVVVGTNNLTTGGFKHPVVASYPHEKYDPKTEQNNVAILKVQRMNFSNKVGPIALEKKNIDGSEGCTLSGWGTTSSPGSNPNKLQYINLITTTNKLCASANQGLKPIKSSQICTLTRAGQGSCSGDAGGPLVRYVSGIPKLIGIVNWMTYPCAIGKPDVYSKASAYYDWFRKKCKKCI